MNTEIGAGDEKFANTVGYKTAKEGKRVKETYLRKLPRLKALIDHLERQMKDNPWRGGGYIQVAGGAWVWCQSTHKILNYLLMGSEAQLQNEAICWVNVEMMRRGLSGIQLAGIHDELTFEFDLIEEVPGKALLSEMYGVASERFGLEVPITGTAQSGHNWLDIH